MKKTLILLCTVFFFAHSCGKKSALKRPEGSSYPNNYPSNQYEKY